MSADSVIIEVDSERYYFAAGGCSIVASRLSTGFQGVADTLAGCDAMGGSDDAGHLWGTDYDEQVRETLSAINELIQAFDNYSELLMQAGRNHDLGDYESSKEPGPPPELPSDIEYAGLVSPTNPASAVGNGAGGLESFQELIDSIGIPCPNGNTEKLAIAAEGWDRVAQYTVDDAVIVVEQFIGELEEILAPEVDLVVADCRELLQALQDSAAAARALAQSCRDYGASIDDARWGMTPILQSLMVDLGLTLVVTVLASVVSAGTSTVVGAANAGRLMKAAADLIRPIVRILVDKAPSLLARERVGDAASRVSGAASRIRAKSKKDRDDGESTPPRQPEPGKPWTPKEQAAYDYATRPERLRHTFHPKHNFDPLVDKFGSEEAVISEFLRQIRGVTPAAGKFEEAIIVNGQNVIVRGFVHDGVVKISTAFTP